MGDFLKKVGQRLKSWWGLLFGTSFFHLGNIEWAKLRDMIWGRLGDADLFHTVIGWFGISTETLITFLLGPEFSLMMATVGALGMIFLEKPEIVSKHPITKPLGAAIFVFFASVVGTSLFFEEAIQTPKFAEITQFYLDSESNRTVSKIAIEKMAGYLRSNPSIAQLLKGDPAFYLYSSSDNGSEEYAGDLLEAFHKVGIDANYDGQGGQDPGQTGIIVLLFDPKHPSPEAVAFMSLLTAASISYTPELWADHTGWPDYPGFLVFVTRDIPVPN